MTRKVCFYHTDGDGYASGAIVGHTFGWNVELIKHNYGWPFPWETIDEDTEVYMVDVSLRNLEEMYKLKSKCKKLVWIDHEDIVDEYLLNCKKLGEIEGLTGSHQGLSGFAACELVWNKFKHNPIPLSISLLGRYDIWDHKDPRVLNFQYGFRSLNLDPGTYEGMAGWDILLGNVDYVRELLESEILNIGKTIHNYVIEENKKKAKSAFMTELGGIPMLALNGVGNSLVFDDVLKKFPEAKACLLFNYSSGCWRVNMFSLKGRTHPPLGQTATYFGKDEDYGGGGGGGGRHGAAGFTWHGVTLPFNVPIYPPPGM